MTDPIDLITRAGWAATHAATPEEVVNRAMLMLWESLGDRQAHLTPGALDEGQAQFFVGGAFFVTPDQKHQMLIGNIGFPPEQRRLLIPIDGGHPGRVIATAAPLLLKDTRKHAEFKQYLKTARMSSAIYAPLIWDGAAHGLIIVAAQAGDTMRDSDLSVLKAVAPTITANWLRLGGPDWLADEYSQVITT